MTELVAALTSQGQLAPERREQLREVAQDLEASFLSEMLRHAGAASSRDSLGGGIGEEQFSSFLRNEQARAMAQHGGVGLAEALFNALASREVSGQ